MTAILYATFDSNIKHIQFQSLFETFWFFIETGALHSQNISGSQEYFVLGM